MCIRDSVWVVWSEYEINGSMFMALAEYTVEQTEEILLQMDTYEDLLPIKDGQTQTVGGIVQHDEPLFFELTYIKQPGEMTLFLEINETDCDTYLDYMNLNKTLIQCNQNLTK